MTSSATDAPRPPRPIEAVSALLPGLGLAVAIALVATAIGRLVPVLGSPVPGIVIGAGLGVLIRPGARLKPGIGFAGKRVLQCAVVLLGSQLSIVTAARVGLLSLPVMLGTLVICLLAAWLIGRALGVIGDLRTLIGVGTAICGASAIAAVAPVIDAASADVAYAVSTIFLFNVAAVLIFPVVGHLLGLSQHAFGLFAGTAVNDTSSVVATATSYGATATRYAVVVKLVRTLMIIPISVALAAAVGRRGRAEGDAPRLTVGGAVRLIPWFLVGFLILAAVNTTGVIPGGAHPALAAASTFLITVALSAIGLSTDLAGLRRAGARPLVLGACLWVVVALSSLGLQLLSGTL